jgi:hypothetical protein
MHACETQLPYLPQGCTANTGIGSSWVQAMLTLAHSPRGSGISAVRALNREVVSATSDGDIVYRTKVVAPRQQGLIAATGEPASFEQPMTGEQLMLEIDRGNLTKVRVLLASGVPADTSMDSGQKTALMLAAERGHVSVAKELILNGADPNGTSKLVGFTPLMAAAAWGQADVITLLISAGADVDARTVTANAVSAIDIAQKRGHGEVVRKLLVAGATLPAMVDPTRSVLELAASKAIRPQRNHSAARTDTAGHPSCVIL